MKPEPQTRPLLRAIKVFAATIVLAIIALAPVFAVSVLAPDPMSDDSVTGPQVSSAVTEDSDVVETVLVTDPESDADLGDEFTATKDPHDESERRDFTIVIDHAGDVDIFDSSEHITITLNDDSSNGGLQPTWINSGCSIYVGPYDSHDSEQSSVYSTYEGSVRVLDEESRRISDDCTLYWIDADGADW